MSEYVLDVQGLSKTFSGVRVLNQLTLRVSERDGVVALTGPNAAGKTTLFNILNGFERPDTDPSTVIRIFGHTTIGLDSWQIARLGVARLFQDARAFLGMTVLQNVQVAAHAVGSVSWPSVLRRPTQDRLTREALEFVGLWSRRNEPAAVLSLGDRRKLAIASMLRTGANLMLLDEPTANLDADATRHMKALVRSLASEGRSVVLIEHNQEFVNDVADVVYAFSHGACAPEPLDYASPAS
jgi:branched-chain amino acid transport system ATP-binding protein